MKRICFKVLLTAALAFLNAASLTAAGFGLSEQSASALGNANAGGAAIAEDASTIYFNPAGITRLCGRQVVGSFHVVDPSAKWHDEGTIITPLLLNAPVPPNPGPGGGDPIPGHRRDEAGTLAPLANFYYSHQITDYLFAGLSITAPFGLVTSYDDDWTGRYHALHSALKTVEINPVVAYSLNGCFSVGGGVRVVYAHAKLTNDVDYGTIAWLNTLTLGGQAPVVETGLNALGFQPTTQDGRVRVRGNAWGVGGNLGLLFEPCCGTRLGVSWRSQVNLNIEGREHFSQLPALIEDPSLAGPLSAFFQAIKAAVATDTGVKAKVKLPDLVLLSAYQELGCWALMGDISWTRWSTLQKLLLRFDNPLQPDNVTTLKWRNSLRYSLGATYSGFCRWKLRSGIAWDETPIRSPKYRTPRIPDNDRFWLALGAGYQWSQCLHFDVAYAHLFIRDTRIDKAGFDLPEETVRGGLVGKYDENANIFSAQLVWSF